MKPLQKTKGKAKNTSSKKKLPTLITVNITTNHSMQARYFFLTKTLNSTITCISFPISYLRKENAKSERKREYEKVAHFLFFLN